MFPDDILAVTSNLHSKQAKNMGSDKKGGMTENEHI
jgi:hypothetical protein